MKKYNMKKYKEEVLHWQQEEFSHKNLSIEWPSDLGDARPALSARIPADPTKSEITTAKLGGQFAALLRYRAVDS